jgi:hypothetical protein
MNNLENKKYKSVNQVMFIEYIMGFIFVLFALGVINPVIIYILEDFQTGKLGLVIFMVITYFVGSFIYTKWYLWAFRNTKKEDWTELEQKVFERRIIHRKNCWYRTRHQKKLIKELTNELRILRKENSLPPLKLKKKWLEKIDSFIPYDILLFFIIIFIFEVYSNYF